MVSAALIRRQIETSLNSKTIRNTFGIPKPVRKPKEKPENYTPVLSPPAASDPVTVVPEPVPEPIPEPISEPVRSIRNKKPRLGDLDLNTDDFWIQDWTNWVSHLL